MVTAKSFLLSTRLPKISMVRKFSSFYTPTQPLSAIAGFTTQLVCTAQTNKVPLASLIEHRLLPKIGNLQRRSTTPRITYTTSSSGWSLWVQTESGTGITHPAEGVVNATQVDWSSLPIMHLKATITIRRHQYFGRDLENTPQSSHVLNGTLTF